MFRTWSLLAIVLSGFVPSLFAAPSPALAAALEAFRTEGPKGWAFTQTTTAEGRTRVEQFDPLQPEHLRMSLISENGVPPTAEQTRIYREQQTRRTGGQNAPNVKEQLDYATAEMTSHDEEREIWHFQLQPGGGDDSSAEHMTVTLTFHVPSLTIERIVLASFEPFSPVLGVKVESARTEILYSLASADRPSLLQHIGVTIRGRAFWFKSLDSDMTVTYSDHHSMGKK